MISHNAQKNILLFLCVISIFFLGFTKPPWQYIGLVFGLITFVFSYIIDYLEKRKNV